ncbi:hypothetical protein [Demequina sp. NBRC 110055]|uniref:hypothetical protein n=1 Tax=Demequina sp. NBRC 110055 TaxID=1570344 RepID=UPI00118543F3|nr:hypothetical protein [Demequina sp. NBRC 110055]
MGTGDAAPWWGVPVIAGGFLVLGAALGYWFNRLQDSRRAEREDVQRWDHRILELTTGVIAKVHAFNLVALHEGSAADGCRVLQKDGLIAEDDATAPFREMYSFAQVGQAFVEVAEACASLELIAPTTVRKAAANVRSVQLSAHPASGQNAMAPIVNELDDKRRELERTVREHFGIK